MKLKSFRRTLTIISATLLVGVAHADTPRQESAGAMLDDSVITTKLKAAFVQDDKVSALRINVTSNHGIVQLSGFANSSLEANRAAEIARRIPGVKDVKNDIILK